jgi:hypothetical protein
MRSLELHVFETEHDVDVAIQSGTALPEQIAHTSCTDCEGAIGYSSLDGFEPFVFVIDENDQDWVVCSECASPIIDYVDAFFPPVVKSRFYDEDLDYF